MGFHAGDLAVFYEVIELHTEKIHEFFYGDMQGFYFRGVQQDFAVSRGAEFAVRFDGDGTDFVQAAFDLEVIFPMVMEMPLRGALPGAKT